MTAPTTKPTLALPLRAELRYIIDANRHRIATAEFRPQDAAAIVAAVNRLAEVERERDAMRDQVREFQGQVVVANMRLNVARDMAEALREAVQGHDAREEGSGYRPATGPWRAALAAWDALQKGGK